VGLREKLNGDRFRVAGAYLLASFTFDTSQSLIKARRWRSPKA
jgi:hypothetical protein